MSARRATLVALAALAVAGCPSRALEAPLAAPVEPVAEPPPTTTPSADAPVPDANPQPEGGSDDGGAANVEDAPRPRRTLILYARALDTTHVDCDAYDDIRIGGYPARVPDCDSDVVCGLTPPTAALRSPSVLATGGDPAVCERKLNHEAGEYSWRPLPELTRRMRKICQNACCGLAVRGCL